jgi:hypothetical protein
MTPCRDYTVRRWSNEQGHISWVFSEKSFGYRDVCLRDGPGRCVVSALRVYRVPIPQRGDLVGPAESFLEELLAVDEGPGVGLRGVVSSYQLDFVVAQGLARIPGGVAAGDEGVAEEHLERVSRHCLAAQNPKVLLGVLNAHHARRAATSCTKQLIADRDYSYPSCQRPSCGDAASGTRSPSDAGLRLRYLSQTQCGRVVR